MTLSGQTLEELAGLGLDQVEIQRTCDIENRIVLSVTNGFREFAVAEKISEQRAEQISTTTRDLLKTDGLKWNELANTNYEATEAADQVLHRATSAGLMPREIDDLCHPLLTAFYKALLKEKIVLTQTEADFRSLVLKKLNALSQLEKRTPESNREFESILHVLFGIPRQSDIGTVAPKAVPILIELISQSNSKDRAVCIAALGKVGPEDAYVHAVLLEHAFDRHESLEVIEGASRALNELGEKVVPKVCKELLDRIEVYDHPFKGYGWTKRSVEIVRFLEPKVVEALLRELQNISGSKTQKEILVASSLLLQLGLSASSPPIVREIIDCDIDTSIFNDLAIKLWAVRVYGHYGDPIEEVRERLLALNNKSMRIEGGCALLHRVVSAGTRYPTVEALDIIDMFKLKEEFPDASMYTLAAVSDGYFRDAREICAREF